MPVREVAAALGTDPPISALHRVRTTGGRRVVSSTDYVALIS